jgi:Uma2 family endonuclease
MLSVLDQLFDSPRMILILDQLQARSQIERVAREAYRASLMPNDRREFINGKVVEHVPTRRVHNRVTDRAYDFLSVVCKKRHTGKVGTRDYLVPLTRNDVIPDVMFWRTETWAKTNPSSFYFPIPELIIEVLSPSTERRDRKIKFDDYAAHGVLEYWIVDADAESVEQYRLVDGEYQLVAKLKEGFLTCDPMSDAQFPVRALFNDQTLDDFDQSVGSET